MPTASITQASFTQSSDANFRLYGKWLSDQLLACGWVQTADTGQINWATVVRAAANVLSGYEVFRMADTLQATTPVYLRIEHYGNASSYPQIRLLVSLGPDAGTDGAGNLTGQIHYLPGATTYLANASSVTASNNWYAAGDTGRFWILFAVSGAGYATNSPLGFFIERTKDSAGADTAEGVVVTTQNGTSTWYQYVLVPTGRLDQTKLNAFTPAAGVGVAGADSLVYPVFPILNGLASWPIRGLVVTFDTIVAEGSTYTFSFYGATRTYLALANLHTITPGGSSNQAVLVQWE
jgi:hypothetical protein